jgi:hypothetical protein
MSISVDALEERRERRRESVVHKKGAKKIAYGRV